MCFGVGGGGGGGGVEVVIRSLLYCSTLQFHNSFLLEEFSLRLVDEREERIYFFLL